VGIARIKEALEANDWTGASGGLEEEEFDDEIGEDAEVGFGREAAEMEMEMFAMKAVVQDLDEGGEHEPPDEESQVQELESLMLRLQAVKGWSFLRATAIGANRCNQIRQPICQRQKGRGLPPDLSTR